MSSNEASALIRELEQWVLYFSEKGDVDGILDRILAALDRGNFAEMQTLAAEARAIRKRLSGEHGVII